MVDADIDGDGDGFLDNLHRNTAREYDPETDDLVRGTFSDAQAVWDRFKEEPVRHDVTLQHTEALNSFRTPTSKQQPATVTGYVNGRA